MPLTAAPSLVKDHTKNETLTPDRCAAEKNYHSRVVGKTASVLWDTAKSLTPVASLVKRSAHDAPLQAIPLLSRRL
jgi:hypothetical protein